MLCAPIRRRSRMWCWWICRSATAWPAARNLGAEQAKAPVLVAMDAHCLPRHGMAGKASGGTSQTRRRHRRSADQQRRMPRSHDIRPDHPRSGIGRRMAAPASGQALRGPAGRLRVHGDDPRVLRSGGPFRRHAQLWNGRRGTLYPLLASRLFCDHGSRRRSGALVQESSRFRWAGTITCTTACAPPCCTSMGNGWSGSWLRLQAKPEFSEAVASLLVSDIWTRYSLRAHRPQARCGLVLPEIRDRPMTSRERGHHQPERGRVPAPHGG